MPRTSILPYNKEAEKNLLASIMLESRLFFNAIGSLSASDFFVDQHKIIFQAMQKVSESGEEVSCLLLEKYLSQSKELERAGGIEYLITLLDSIPTTAFYRQYIDIIKETSQLRQIAILGEKIKDYAIGNNLESGPIIDNAISELFKITSGGLKYNAETDVVTPAKLANDILTKIEYMEKNKGQLRGIGVGFPELDRITKGLRELTLIAAQTGRGKTTLAMNWAINIAIKQKIPVLLINCEMEALDLGYRIISNLSGVDEDCLSYGNIRNDEWPKIINAISKLSESKLIVTNHQPKDINNIIGLIHQHKIQNGIKVVIIDYMKEIKRSGSIKGSYETYEELGIYAQLIKETCSRLDIKPVIINQLNKKDEIANSKQLEDKASLFVTIEVDGENGDEYILHVRKNRGGKAPVKIPLYTNLDSLFMAEQTRENTVPF